MRLLKSLAVAGLLCLAATPLGAQGVRVKDLGRFLGWRDNALVGYGIVTGLSGSGDSQSSQVTQEAVRNVLSRMGANITPDEVHSRNVAVVMVTAVLPPSAHLGDKLDATVSSIGDARSLAGGILLMTPLMGPDQRTYALAQGPLVVGGYRFDIQMNRQQKNYPTSGVLPGGASVEVPVSSTLIDGSGALTFILKDPDTTTAERIKDGINTMLGAPAARVDDAATVVIDARGAGDLYHLVAQIENVAVTPDDRAVVVINERSGTVVAGGGVQISSVVISQGDIKISISQDNDADQPFMAQYGGWNGLVVSSKKLEANEDNNAVVRFPSSTVADLVEALARAHVDTRGVITILESIKAAGALHADIVVQ